MSRRRGKSGVYRGRKRKARRIQRYGSSLVLTVASFMWYNSLWFKMTLGSNATMEPDYF